MAKLIRNKDYKSNFQRIRENIYNKKIKKLGKKRVILNSIKPLIRDDKTKQNIINNKGIQNTLYEHLCRIRQQIEDEKTIVREQSSIKEGFIYLISNPIWNGWIKAGMTTDYESRISTYNIYDPTNSYSYVDIKWTSDRKYAENHLLNVLSIHSKERKGEWFKISVEKAKILMQTTV
jgi:hypothetical protein